MPPVPARSLINKEAAHATEVQTDQLKTHRKGCRPMTVALQSDRTYAGNSPYSLPLTAKPTELGRGRARKFRCCMFENKIPDDFENPPGHFFRSQKEDMSGQKRTGQVNQVTPHKLAS